MRIPESIKQNGLSPFNRLPTVFESFYMSQEKTFPCFLRTIKGGVKLCDQNGFRFIRNRVEGTKIYWNCERKKKECKARAISNSDETGVAFNDVLHNHSPPEWRFQRQKENSVHNTNTNWKQFPFKFMNDGKCCILNC